jgi:hypothetical protein
MLRVVVVVALLGCRHGASTTPAIGNTASVGALSAVRKPTPEDLKRARSMLERARVMAGVGVYTLAYAAAQRGINLLDGDPDLDDGALLELGKSQIADEELVIMTELRTRELERRISQR